MYDGSISKIRIKNFVMNVDCRFYLVTKATKNLGHIA